ncbi:MAG: DUF3576 domain-containing protein [Alphaproteobacteria bacterium]|nr:DUF3576 domain-containing protein [Alphaproteobacteria bacterium]
MFVKFPPILLVSIFVFAACSGKIEAPEIGPEKDKVQREIDATGKLGDGDGLLNELIRGRSGDGGVGTGIGVNAYLWQASLDTLSFMPLANADSFGGIIITDWYTPDPSTQTRYKVNVYIVGRELRSDTLRVVSFKQKYAGNNWLDVGDNKVVNNQLENAILTRARQMRINANAVVE